MVGSECVLGEQLGFELWERTHDLPPRWDGLIVEWGDWQDLGVPFICPPPKEPRRCGKCGSTQPEQSCLGRLFTDPALTVVAAIGKARQLRGRHPVGVLSAFRCTDCGHDVVLDPEGVSWDLDDTDYGDAGSSAVK